jgi:quercetin dioxygenase-like cupin family protein
VEGAATLQAGGEEHELRPGSFARVGPGEKRKIVTGEEGARVIAIGGVPGKAYEIPPFTAPQEAQQA